VPLFQKLERIKGSWDEISAQIQILSDKQSQAWLEVTYEGEEVIADLRERLDAAMAETEMEILRVKSNRLVNRVLSRIDDNETLDDLNVNDVV